MKQLSTGVNRLDSILTGGLIEYDTHLVYGPPGTGKTILCHQICFHLIKTKAMRCIYLNLLTETPNEIISHLEQFSFFDKNALPDSLYYLMAQGQIKKEGIESLVPLISETIQHKKAGIFIFEGIENVIYQEDSKINFIELITKIRILAKLHFCTVILTIKQGVPDPALTVVDSIIELSDEIIGPRSVKQITVHKTRGSALLPGRHEVELTKDGIQVHPRLESLSVPSSILEKEERKCMALGIPKLDSMMEGGILSRSNLAIIGMPGTGKTTLGLSFLIEGARLGQQGVYMGFLESPAQLLRKTDSLHLPLRSFVEQHKIHLFRFSTHEVFIDAIAERLLELLRSQKCPEKRVFIDGIEGFNLAAVYAERLPLFFSALFDHLHSCRATTVISKNLPLFKPSQIMTEYIEQLCDSTIMLRYMQSGMRICRFLTIMKMRESCYCADMKSFQIGKGGFSICDIDNETAEILRRSPDQF